MGGFRHGVGLKIIFLNGMGSCNDWMTSLEMTYLGQPRVLASGFNSLATRDQPNLLNQLYKVKMLKKVSPALTTPLFLIRVGYQSLNL